MKEIKIGIFGRARVWINEPAIAPFRGSLHLETQIARAPTTATGSPSRSAVVEVLLPRGARAEYALLGLRYEAKPTSVLTVEISSDARVGSELVESLASGIDQIFVGLPEEFVAGVHETVVAECGCLGAGRVVLDHAAYGSVGSSLRVFRAVGRAAMRLIAGEGDSVLQDVL